MAEFSTGYQRLPASYTDTPPGEHDLLVHVADGSKSPWHHIENLDLFFTRIYQLHQKRGFLCMLLSEMFELVQLVFVVTFTTFLFNCVDYDILFANKVPGGVEPGQQVVKVTLPDALLPTHTCTARIRDSPLMVTVLLTAAVFWLHRLIKFIYNVCCYWEIRAFYRNALNISQAELPYRSWQEVQARMLQVQREQLMCIHKRELTELDISHRILRFTNYMVAMLNKSLLPVRFQLPLLGEVVFLSRGLRYNYELIFLWGPGSLFLNQWSLKAEYKRAAGRHQLAQKLRQRILWVGLANLLLCPLVLVWQILYAFFSYGEVLKRQPGSLGLRCWSLYGRSYLRHFNELDHQLQARLSQGYKPATKYMDGFPSPLAAVIARNLAFFAGSILAVLIALTVYDEDVLAVEHVLTAGTLLGLAVTVCRCFIPDQHVWRCPEQLLQLVLTHVHYMPDHWQGNAHRYETRDQFAQLFQYKAVSNRHMRELLSPLLTPLVLIFCLLRRRSLEIIDFFSANFTVEVVGVGDTCSFAQNGRPSGTGTPAWPPTGVSQASAYQQAEGGKTELSLVQFALSNPHWLPPPHSSQLIHQLMDRVAHAQPGGGTRTAPQPGGQSSGRPRHGHRDGAGGLTPLLHPPRTRPESADPRPQPGPGSGSGPGPGYSASPGGGGRSLSSGSSVWEGQLLSGLVLGTPPTHVSLHALYMHELHHQQVQAAPSRHVWYRHGSDSSEGSEGGADVAPPSPLSSPLTGSSGTDPLEPTRPHCPPGGTGASQVVARSRDLETGDEGSPVTPGPRDT
ncbi:LOW QUALITY PROTEIN: autophagy-related protein 9A-like [Leucoraja erinacea]|uniref:LOW QUALITY PROTEIN: autophagy-related protein 9A-like n=1 Tax=Leucoraja erinaceus TaxID=7782 RepID=UPI002456B97A|nr:LOW QUALITY PROTEIN: autophagy-related protein 9A-like [Leucoraja erinacea]